MPRPKKPLDNGPSTYKDTVPLNDDDDFNTIQFTIAGGDNHVSARSALDNQSDWAATTSWAPNDDPNLELDDDDCMFEDAMNVDVGESFTVPLPQVQPPRKARKPKSQASVSTLMLL